MSHYYLAALRNDEEALQTLKRQRFSVGQILELPFLYYGRKMSLVKPGIDAPSPYSHAPPAPAPVMTDDRDEKQIGSFVGVYPGDIPVGTSYAWSPELEPGHTLVAVSDKDFPRLRPLKGETLAAVLEAFKADPASYRKRLQAIPDDQQRDIALNALTPVIHNDTVQPYRPCIAATAAFYPEDESALFVRVGVLCALPENYKSPQRASQAVPPEARPGRARLPDPG